MNEARIIPQCKDLTIEELDGRLEQAVRENERSERLICFYLVEMRDRRGEQGFGFADIWDYAAERFGFSERKTAYLLRLGTKLKSLPHLADALASGRLGWTKAVRVAEVATTQDEAMWVESAVSLSVRELDRRIRDGAEPKGGRVSMWLTSDQNAVWQRALEVCRRVAGAELDPGRCLELIAGEFLATYEALDNHGEDLAKDESNIESEAGENSDDAAMCPDDAELPSPVAAPYSEIHREVLHRDGYSCQCPGCSARMGLHVHHIEYRSRSGSKRKALSNTQGNLTVVCFAHHRMLHASVIGVRGTAPGNLEWRRPKPMEEAMARTGQDSTHWQEPVPEPEGSPHWIPHI